MLVRMSKDSKLRQKPSRFVLGRTAYASISAVEGLVLTRDMQAEFTNFDSAGIDAQTRRRELAKRYGR
jgi:hypothetical protein